MNRADYELTLNGLIYDCQQYTSQKPEKVFAVRALGRLLTERLAGRITPQNAIRQIDQVLDNCDNLPIFASGCRKSRVKVLCEGSRDFIAAALFQEQVMRQLMPEERFGNE